MLGLRWSKAAKEEYMAPTFSEKRKQEPDLSQNKAMSARRMING